jgi:hypothetical protein
VEFIDLSAVNWDLALQLEELARQARILGAGDGYQRLVLTGKHFKQLSIAEAYRLIEPAKLQGEVEDAQAQKYWVNRLHIIRNCLALGPLILTWIALYFASNEYQQDLRKYPNDLYEPFLKLWQFGFHNTTGFTFSVAAFIDVVLLITYLLSIIAVALFETRAQKVTQDFAITLHKVTDMLITTIARTGAASTSDVDRIVRTIEHVADQGFKALTQTVKSLADADAERIAQALRVVIQDTLKLSEEIADQAKQTLTDVNADLKDLTRQLRLDLGTLGADLNTLSSGLIGYDQQLQQLTDASTELANASISLATNTDSLTQSTQSYTDIGKDIGVQISSLNGSQQQIITTFGDIKRDAVAQMGSFAAKLDTTAQVADRAAQNLLQITAKDVITMSNHVTSAAAQVADTAKALKQLQFALEKSDKHLQWTLSQADQHLQQSLSHTDQHLQSSVQQMEAQLQTTNAALLKVVQGLANITSLQKPKRGLFRRQ